MSFREFTAVFGGTFDPPHLGHREAVRALFDRPGVKSALVIPAGNPPHKKFMATPEQRLRMAQLNFSSHPGLTYPDEVQVLDLEITRSGQPNYSFDTLSELRRDYGKLAFVLGADQFAQIQSWYRYPEVLDLCHWLVLARKPDGERLASQTIQRLASSGIPGTRLQKITVLETPAPEISSTRIREIIGKTGRTPEGALLGPVLAYLKREKIYGISPD